ncbi:MAG: Hsp33 family molecular chaperone HslO [Desulfuromonas sp.]|nr:MAG: Hsp33 family molecular chaperone HslO [Desulfuromonas sp.]
MQDHLVRAVSRDGLFRGVVAVTTDLVSEACRRHQTDFTASVAFGRLLTGGALLSCLLKGKQRLALMVEGNGPLEKISVEADADGRVRGTIRNPVAGLPPRDGRFDVAGAVGRAGFLHVWKDFGLKEPYQSMVQLQSSEIGEDLAWYLTHSEQVPSSIGLGVELDSGGAVGVAGGFMIQSLPPGDDAQIEALADKLQQLPPITSLLKEGQGPGQILAEIFAGFELALLHEVPLVYSCPCSNEQIEQMLIGLGRNELEALAAEHDPVEVVCEYCRTAYRFDRKAMERLMKNGSAG